MQIRRGVTRTVLITKRYAIKVPRLYDFKGMRAWSFNRGWAANISERDWTEYTQTAFKVPQVCPVLKSFLGGLINVYPRAELEHDEEKLYDLYGKLEFSTPSDAHVGNLGWWNGYFVWLDYDMNWNDCKRCGIDDMG